MKLVQELLIEAIAGETGAEKKYALFREQARQENLFGLASLFEALSRAEAIHIANHTRALKKCGYQQDIEVTAESITTGKTLTNLKEAIDCEYEEMKRMYPSFRRLIIRAHGKEFLAKVALLSMKWAQDSEREHYKLLKAAKERLEKGSDSDDGEYYLCRVCGNIVKSSQSPKTQCPICGHDHSFYQQVSIQK